MTNEPAAYRITSPHGNAAHADGLASMGPGQTPPTWFIDGYAYVPAGHPRLPYYRSTHVVEPADEVPLAYRLESERLTREPHQHLAPPPVDAAA